MSDEQLTPDELDNETAEALPDRDAMSVIAPIEGTVDGDEILFPSEKDIGDPVLPN